MKSFFLAVRFLALGVVLAAVVWPGLARAQVLVPAAEFYFDEDRASVAPLDPVPEAQVDGTAVQRLLRQPLRDRRSIEAVGRIAHTAMSTDRVELGRSLYERALSDMDSSHASYRSTLWNYAWDLQRAGLDAEAAVRWQELVSSRGVRGSWMPPTLALSLWRAGHQAEAVRWYAAAVRSRPNDWVSPGDFSGVLPDWRAQDRATLVDVHAAWVANPPSWP